MKMTIYAYFRKFIKSTSVMLRLKLPSYGTLIGNPTPGIQWYNFRPPGVTPNWGMGPP